MYQRFSNTAVRTSLLSRRWRTLWRTSPDVSFTTGLSPSFVDSALRHRDPAVPLRSFSLVAASANSDRAQLPSWIRRAAASPALERLTVRTYAQNHQHSGIVSPAVIRRHSSFIVIDVFRLRLASLRVLELAFPGGGITHVHWPAAAFLPSLQGLDLANLTLFLAAGDAISSSCPALKYCRLSLFAAATPELDVSCPLLEVFELTTRDGPAGDVISICGGSVREVRVRQEIAPSGPAYLKLSAPGLRTLEWVGPLPRSAAVDAAADALVSTLVMRTDSSLVEHDLKKMLLKDGRGRKFSMLKVNRLILPKCCITAALGKLVFDRRNQVNNPPDQEYENLKHLELIAYFGGSSSLGVAFLLKMFSKIETLRVSLSGGCTKDSIINNKMEEEPAAKRRPNNIKKEEEEDEKAARKADCISGLPDHLLHEILACLPTSIAACTSLLSRRWRTVWTTSPDLSFTTDLSPSFVDSVLRLRDPAVPLRSFSLATSDYAVSDPARARSWIDYAANYSALQHLNLKLVLTDSIPAFRSFRLPPAVFRLQHLRVLQLQLPGVVPHLDWPATAFLPSLQRLELADLDLSLVAGDAISKSCPALKCLGMSLFCGPPQLDVNCPLLEVFELRTHVGLAGGRISICGSSVREVRVRQELAGSAPAYLKLSTPGLRILEWLGPPPPRSITISAPLPPSGFTYLVHRDDATAERTA
ncbi:putative F-box/FBD/LRR-repeat protein [Ananas comosus]|uniref:Putative F-box/FBD/LRR-repeat protein n=1 Tax=Ananas comosus TaxID=4615 RepID=A0A199UDM3_ANACO|nr:putative F-box/FBD/LRR-repeat protein [Ananas comosus]